MASLKYLVLFVVAVSLLIGSCTFPEAKIPNKPTECQVYNVTQGGCSERAEIFLIKKTGECFLAIYADNQNQYYARVGVSIIKVSDYSCR